MAQDAFPISGSAGYNLIPLCHVDICQGKQEHYHVHHSGDVFLLFSPFFTFFPSLLHFYRTNNLLCVKDCQILSIWLFFYLGFLLDFRLRILWWKFRSLLITPQLFTMSSSFQLPYFFWWYQFYTNSDLKTSAPQPLVAFSILVPFQHLEKSLHAFLSIPLVTSTLWASIP